MMVVPACSARVELPSMSCDWRRWARWMRLSAALGLARAFSQATETAPLLVAVQRDLYHIMAETAATPENAARFRPSTRNGSPGWRRKSTR